MYINGIKGKLCYLSASCKIGIERPVTPEVAGSSPVRSAIHKTRVIDLLGFFCLWGVERPIRESTQGKLGLNPPPRFTAFSLPLVVQT